MSLDTLTRTELRFVNARVVAPAEDFAGSVVVRDGLIHAVERGAASAADAIDLDGELLIPGLIDLHTDNLERHFEPRPGAQWDPIGAAMAHDGQIAAAGVTTVYDSLSLHGEKAGFDRGAALRPMIKGVRDAQEAGVLRVEHFLHLRCEVTNPDLVKVATPFLDEPWLRLLSLMDHTPGQRQMRNMDAESFKQMLRGFGKTEAEIEELEAKWSSGAHQDAVAANRAAVIRIAADRGLPLATHDDETVAHVDEAAAAGIAISEFPVTKEAAERARGHGMLVLMGAPNMVRGGSHSGNVSARELAAAHLLDGFASDYIPLSMLRSAFMLRETPFDYTLSEAVATVSAAPARAAGLTDRGEIAPGRRADLVHVALSDGGWPVVRGVWRGGRRVA